MLKIFNASANFAKKLFSTEEITGLKAQHLDAALTVNPDIVNRSLAIINGCKVPIAAGSLVACGGLVGSVFAMASIVITGDVSQATDDLMLNSTTCFAGGAITMASGFLPAHMASARILNLI